MMTSSFIQARYERQREGDYISIAEVSQQKEAAPPADSEERTIQQREEIPSLFNKSIKNWRFLQTFLDE